MYIIIISGSNVAWGLGELFNVWHLIPSAHIVHACGLRFIMVLVTVDLGIRHRHYLLRSGRCSGWEGGMGHPYVCLQLDSPMY